MSTAILIDGAFFKKRHSRLYGKFTAVELAQKMVDYSISRLKDGENSLYRIFIMIVHLLVMKGIIL